MYRRILVPVDITHKDRGREMIEVARSFANEAAKITLLSVVEDVPSYVMVQLPESVLEDAKETAHQELAAIAAAAGVEAEVETRRGRAHSAILAYAAETDADLIIIASHQPGLQHFLLGSTAAKVVRHATCSVLVLR